MQVNNRVLDDLVRVANGALGTMTGVKAEIKGTLRRQFERVLADMDVVSREEFEVVRAMAVKAREENARMERRLAALEDGPDGSKAASSGPCAEDPHAD